MVNERSCCCSGLSKGWWWLLTLIGLPLLYYSMLSAKWDTIEKDIQSRTIQELSTSGENWSDVKIEGRDILLTGTTGSETQRDNAIKIVKGVKGVRIVDSNIDIVALKELALLASYDHKDGKLVLEGVLSSQDKVDEILKKLADSIGLDNIVNKLTVSDKYADEGGTIVLSGLVLSDDEKSNILSAVKAGSDTLDLQLTNNLEIDTAALKAISDAKKLAAEKAEAEKAEAEKAEAEKLAAEKLATEKAKAEADKAEAEKIEAEKVAKMTTAKANINACQTKLNSAMTNKTILFETNKANIKDSSFSLLKTMAAVIIECSSKLPNARILVGGHTDSKGSDTYNLKLSQRRADAVKKYLIGIGVSASIISSKGYGESQPVSSNDTEEGRSQNRRITFSIR